MSSSPCAAPSQPRRPLWSLAGSRGWALALLFVLASLLLPRFAAASRPVIVPGREAEIVALFQPYALGDELAPGWTLHSFAIDVATIKVWLAGPDQAYALVHLEHLDYGPADARELECFALSVVEQPSGSEAALAELAATLARNDDGSFWRTDVAYADEAGGDPQRGLSLVRAWAKDGLVLLTLFVIVLFGLVAHKLRGAEPWMKWALLGIVVVGAALRLTLSPQVALAPWAYTRFLISARLIFNGPALAALHPGPIWMSETITTSTLVLALLAPLAVYVHARYLLDDHRAALFVAGIVAILPLHLRFSHSDAAFIPSITVSSTLFTLIHVATRDPSKRIGWFAVALVGFPLALVYLVRPLNIMYYPLLIATAFVNHGVYSVKPKANRVRVGVAFAIVTAVTAFGGVPWLLDSFGAQVSDGLRVETITSAIEVLLSPRTNALLNPVFTPPGLTALALLGAVDLWRRGKRPLFWFLVLWLFGFLIAHAYVIPFSPYMQARYHLHLIVPYMLLAACGIEAALRWLADNRERRVWLAGRRYRAVVVGLFAYLAASPLIHLHGIRYVEFNETREWLFVHSLRDEIPEQCEILEYTGDGADSRFNRVGAYTEAGIQRARWLVHEIPAREPGEHELPDEIRALLEDPPECLMWFEGLPCFGNKPVELGKAPACDAIEGWVVLEEVAGIEYDSVVYDENLGVGLGEIDRIPLTLYRAYRKPR